MSLLKTYCPDILHNLRSEEAILLIILGGMFIAHSSEHQPATDGCGEVLGLAPVIFDRGFISCEDSSQPAPYIG